MLDKEMAEEMSEVANGELEEIKKKLTVLKVKVEVLRNGVESPEDIEKEETAKSPMAYIH